jgi:hypothetical protein
MIHFWAHLNMPNRSYNIWVGGDFGQIFKRLLHVNRSWAVGNFYTVKIFIHYLISDSLLRPFGHAKQKLQHLSRILASFGQNFKRLLHVNNSLDMECLYTLNNFNNYYFMIQFWAHLDVPNRSYNILAQANFGQIFKSLPHVNRPFWSPQTGERSVWSASTDPNRNCLVWGNIKGTQGDIIFPWPKYSTIQDKVEIGVRFRAITVICCSKFPWVNQVSASSAIDSRCWMDDKKQEKDFG